jgi:hypothetical protein
VFDRRPFVGIGFLCGIGHRPRNRQGIF